MSITAPLQSRKKQNGFRLRTVSYTHLPTLNPSEYECKDGNVWIAKSAKIAPTAYINGPAIIGKDVEVRHCAFIRGNVIVGEGAVVGNSTELKNAVLFNKVQVPHYNYVGCLLYTSLFI